MLTQTNSVKANAVNSPLLRLPAEIRNKIYTYSFAPRNAKHIISIKPSTVGYTYEHRRGTEQSRPAFHLIRVCRQIYSEASLLYFQHCVFALHLPRSLVRNWLAKRNIAQRKAFAEIVLHCASYNAMHDAMTECRVTGAKWVPQLEWKSKMDRPYAIVGTKRE